MFKFGGRFGLCTSRLLIPLYYISSHIGDNVSFKFGGVDKHFVCLFYLLFCLFLSIYIYLFLSVFLSTLGTMCHLSLRVWTNTLSVCFICCFVYFCLYISVFVCI
jgi:hypothetical protein